MKTTPKLIQHIESYLGPIECSWNTNLEGDTLPFQVIRCPEGVEATTVFCTLGLSNHPFSKSLDRVGNPIRHELVIAAPQSFGTRNIPPLLQQLGMVSLNRDEAFLRGEIIEGHGHVFPDYPFHGFYITYPTFVPEDDFCKCTREDGVPVIFAWMVPVFENEIRFVKSNGWNAFENMLVNKKADPIDFHRLSLLD